MRVSIINPAKKRKTKKRKGHKGQSRKQRAASLKNLRKARAARKSKGSHAPKKRKSKKARKSKRKTKKAKGKRKSKKARKSKGKPWMKGLRAARKARKAKSRKGKRKSRKSKRHGKAVRPTMYRGRTRKGKKVLRHSPRSRYARRGYRFNPADAVKGNMPAGMRKYMPDFRGAKLDVPHAVGGVMGFITSGYGGGMMRVVVGKYTTNEYAGHAASLIGNIIGTEIPTVVVNYTMHKVKAVSKHAEKVARGMRIGGYVALAFNAGTIVLKVLKIGNLPFRIPSELSPTKELVLNGLGDIDLVGAGLGSIVQGLGDQFVSTSDYAGLGDNGLLDTEISALSAYVGETLDEFSGLPVNDRGFSP